MEAQDANSKNERDDHLDRSEEIPTSDDLSELSTSGSEVEETQATSGTVSDSEENINITSKHNDEISNSFGFEQRVTPSEDAVDNAAATVFQNDEEEQNFSNNATQEAVEAETTLSPNSGSIPEEPESSGNADEFDTFESQETDFNFNEEGQNDDFGDFGDFDGPGDLSNADDDFGDFGDFDEVSEVKNPVEIQPEAIRLDGIDNYLQSLQDGDMNNVIGFLDTFFDKSLDDSTSENNSNALESISDVSNSPDPIQSPSERNLNERSRALLSTETSKDLWDKLSTDSVFYNPITGAVGQFQWTRSEINKVYLRSLGVTINVDDALRHSSSSLPSSPYMETVRSPNGRASQGGYLEKKSPPPRMDRKRSSKHHQHTKASSLSGINLPVREINVVEPKKPEPEPELDIDIARAYCELTEDTVRVFPAVKLTSIITDLTRLQRQASDYLQYLLDQREQLIMDSETYNDLISCIVGHAQRLREQSPKDASPAMVQKKKQGKYLGQAVPGQAAFSASMGGGVVGIKNSAGTGTRKMERGHSTSSIQPVATTSTPSQHAAHKESLID
ncbi:hypothetical protein INT44_005834 [Umbelopsis vinacea]|uniref:Uncharacterized protein n=1 Tax=Umbelopsis vinacea TaxID=44442 RepID=A0A8H7PYZ9_9FUNG|nr:hypothetical protein INT44_005834 [Umbelopsis vinacea]